MRDGFSILGITIYLDNKLWTVKDVCYVYNNTNPYVVLTDGNVQMNVPFEKIINIISNSDSENLIEKSLELINNLITLK